MTLDQVRFVPINESSAQRSFVLANPFDVERAKSVEVTVKQSLAQCIRRTLGIPDGPGSDSESGHSEDEVRPTKLNPASASLAGASFVVVVHPRHVNLLYEITLGRDVMPSFLTERPDIFDSTFTSRLAVMLGRDGMEVGGSYALGFWPSFL
jgi:hypothetical protein